MCTIQKSEPIENTQISEIKRLSVCTRTVYSTTFIIEKCTRMTGATEYRNMTKRSQSLSGLKT